MVANTSNPDQTAPIGDQIWVHIVCNIRAVSHKHELKRNQTVTATELHRFLFGRPFTYELNLQMKSKKMHV